MELVEPQIAEELRAIIERGLASGDLPSPDRVAQQTDNFRDRFGPEVLRNTDGEALLALLHERRNADSRCLAYWLEFKNDEEFTGRWYGGIGGGSALKFGIFQREGDDAWMGGSPRAMEVLPLDRAVAVARRQRDELVRGDVVLAALDLTDDSDAAYSQLQTAMTAAAPQLSGTGWAHKYWFLLHQERVDDYHAPNYQRFQLFKSLQMPPDRVGILDYDAPRFNCAGRFAALARHLGFPITSLTSGLSRRNGAIRRYWRVGTTEGDTGASQWPTMRDGGFASIGWKETIPDLTNVIAQKRPEAKNAIREWLLQKDTDNPGVATRKAGEILRFATEMAELDTVLACDGQQVLGVGRVVGPYEYDGSLAFPHKRRVEWLLLDPWQTPEKEGLRTTVKEFGKSAENLLDLERRLFKHHQSGTPAKPNVAIAPLPSLDPFTSRVDAILRRKSQVIFYGPPGTGKTFRALNVARELASRQAFKTNYESLGARERKEVDDELVQLCTFHPGYGYEDFIEGFRPKTVNGQMVFEPRDGVFKQLCAKAATRAGRNYFLVVDEINRGDIPRIFGELLTVIEQDKRGKPVMLPVTATTFSVPRNVFLIGTMNTADRSISLLDAALRRRFGFVELMPDSLLLEGQSVGELQLGAWLDALNFRLLKHLKRDARNLQVGHAYLMQAPPITSIVEFSRVLRDDIIPLLEDYCYDDFAALRDILGPELVDADAARIREELFLPNREQELMDAVSFEEMQSLLIARGSSENGSDSETDSSDDGEGDDAAGASQ